MPYSSLPPSAFWKLCRNDRDFLLSDIYQPKFSLTPGMRIATAGSCFAQNIGRYVRASELELVDTEPAPALMPAETAQRFGYGLFSARYGNIYTARQLRQLLEDAVGDRLHDCTLWQRDGRFYDGLRPNTEPEGLGSEDELRAHRLDHLRRVRAIFDTADVFVFTLGLTETWTDTDTGVVFPTAPGVIAGQFDPDRHAFLNLGMGETLEDLSAAITLIRELAPEIRILLTVSPVPLTATASGHHVLRATTYSKSVLRAVAEEVAALDPGIDYFPSYEIITGTPFGARNYKDNLRNVTTEGVQRVMSVFFGAHDGLAPVDRPDTGLARPSSDPDEEDAVVCEEAMLEALAPK
ncbi:GSCFA domain-containing protein [Salipiger sp. P9]|uniref:GSCFA domain-containing protein n=1 Tax=Salipiger pentaromativorans TaxID=2943193 RepID=UPI002156F8B3|nr:GSCFA domain-containing protein [Salipiger pentaromativorans]MCR8549012.1 GSCFA domain-containing protein [Salipiger pentaromativorans]